MARKKPNLRVVIGIVVAVAAVILLLLQSNFLGTGNLFRFRNDGRFNAPAQFEKKDKRMQDGKIIDGKIIDDGRIGAPTAPAGRWNTPRTNVDPSFKRWP